MPSESTSGMRKFVRTPRSRPRSSPRAESRAEHADVGGRAADVDDRAVVEPGQERGTAHRVRRARTRTSRPGSARRSRRPSACRRSGSGRAARRCRARRARPGRPSTMRAASSRRRGVHDRRVLPLEQADPADLVRERDRHVRQLAARISAAALELELGVHRARRPTRSRPSGCRCAPMSPACRRSSSWSSGGDEPPVELVAAVAR